MHVFVNICTNCCVNLTPWNYHTITPIPTHTHTLIPSHPHTLTHTQLSGSTRRPLKVSQYHFTAWPDHGVPDYATSILAFHKRVKSQHVPSKGPLLVHCRLVCLSPMHTLSLPSNTSMMHGQCVWV